jgi:crotonobetainyl-CoA:carnitine CoA-transferase CaiB-like acyl-CoA transferase
MERWRSLQRVPAPLLVPEFGPLSGMRVVVTGSVFAGPYIGTLLAEHGAEVIHTERPGVNDALRGQRPIIDRGDGKQVSSAWVQEARNKLCQTLEFDFHIPEAKEIFLGLIKNCDVWIENMVWLDKLGITDEAMFEVNPKLVIAHVSGFGRPQFGGLPEECDRPAFDPVGQAESGLMFLNGYPEPMPPLPVKYMIIDNLTAMYGLYGVLSAYIYAQKTGKGQSIDVSLVEAASRSLNDVWSKYFNCGILHERLGQRVSFQPSDLYKSKDDKWVYIAAFGRLMFSRFLKAAGIDPNKFTFENSGGDPQAMASELGQELAAKIKEFAASRTAEEIKTHLSKYKVPCGIVKSAADLAEDEHYKSRGNIIQYKDCTLEDTVTTFGFCPKLSETPAQVWRGSAKRGQDTDDILKKILCYSDEEIAAFREKGVIE